MKLKGVETDIFENTDCDQICFLVSFGHLVKICLIICKGRAWHRGRIGANYPAVLGLIKRVPKVLASNESLRVAMIKVCRNGT